ncbi:DUF4329 domain-containing protein [Bradyrhizobium manausense]|nr:DUF4329 domain-containing protein [Bradyrhizobium manausense]
MCTVTVIGVIGDYHTHGDYSISDPSTGLAVRTSDPSRDSFDSNNFSTGWRSDIKGITQSGAGIPGYRGYLGTPSGQFKYYDPSTRTTGVLR